MGKSIFREKSLQRISSPEQLNDYIKVSNPSIWLLLGAMGILLVAFLAWASNGNITSQIDSTGVVKNMLVNGSKDNVVVCFVSKDEADKLRAGMEVRILDNKQATRSYVCGKVSYADTVPVSKDTVKSQLGDWLADTLLQESEYGVEVLVGIETDKNGKFGYKWSGEAPESNFIKDNELCKVEIIKESVTPIKFLLN